VAALKRRLRPSPQSVALVIVQTRSNGAFQVLRFVALCEREGFCVDQITRADWNYTEISQRHIYHRRNADPGLEVLPQSETENAEDARNEDGSICRTGREVAEHVLFIRRQK